MEKLEKRIVNKLKEKNETISFMESCTGGYLANAVTNVSGASDVIKTSLVTYSNEYKIKFGVPETIINKYTVYSKETATEMAKNVSLFANSDFGIGVTGELANKTKADNKVYYSIYDKNNDLCINNTLLIEPSDRDKMKQEIAYNILEELWNILTKN